MPSAQTAEFILILEITGGFQRSIILRFRHTEQGQRIEDASCSLASDQALGTGKFRQRVAGGDVSKMENFESPKRSAAP